MKNYEQENAYIISCINADGYDKAPETVQEKLQFLRDTFKAEYGWNIERIGFQNALREWLAGLPSACTIEFYNHEILQLARKWGSLPENATERQEDKILGNYWNFMAVRIIGLFKQYKIKE